MSLSPFTEDFQKLYMQNLALTINCEHCRYKIQFVYGINSYKEVLKSVKQHLIKEHGINPQ